MSTINNILKAENATCAGNAVTQIMAGVSAKSKSLALHNAGSAVIWFDIVAKGASAPTITATAKMGQIQPGFTVPISIDLSAVDIYIQNDTGAATTCAYCAKLLDGDASDIIGSTTGGSGSAITQAKRKDSPGTLAAADGDYAPIQQDADGWVRVVAKGGGIPGLGAEQYGGFPVGGRAASADRSALGATEFGCFTMSLLAKLVNLPYALPASTWNSLTSWAASASSTAAKAAGGAGVRHYVTSITYTDEGGATPTGTHMKVKDGSTVLAKVPLNHTITFPVPLRFTANTAINLEPSASVTGSVTLVGFSAGE